MLPLESSLILLMVARAFCDNGYGSSSGYSSSNGGRSSSQFISSPSSSSSSSSSSWPATFNGASSSSVPSQTSSSSSSSWPVTTINSAAQQQQQSSSSISSSSSSGESSSGSSAAGGSRASPVTESELYRTVSIDDLSQGYGNAPSSGQVERVDEQVVELPVQEESVEGSEQVMDHNLPDTNRQNHVSINKEIHSYVIQKRIKNVRNRILHRYLKNLLVNTIYQTNIQRIKHQKLVNLLINTLQETHQPKLLIKYSRQDTVRDQGERTEQPEVSEEHKENVLPPIFEPATAEKIGYDGNSLGGAVLVTRRR